MNKFELDETLIENALFSDVIKAISDKFKTFKGQIKIDGEIVEEGNHRQYMSLLGFNGKTFHNIFSNMDKKSDASDWYFTGKIILMKDNFQEIKRSRVGRGGTDLLKKINEYEGENCYIPTNGHCFIKCVNRVLNKDLTCKFQEYINGFSKANRKGVMTCARMNEFNKKFNTSFQIYNPKNRHFHPRDVHDELDWVLYLHNSHFCLIRRSQKSLGIQEIEDNYEQVWKTCRDDNAVTQVSPLKLNVLSSMSDDALFAWDCETYSEKDTRRAIPYCCTLINLEKLRKMLNRINNLFPDLKPTDPIPEEFYDKLMNVVEIFLGTDCIDQMLKYLGQYDRKRLILISHNGSGFDNWIVLKNAKKLTHCPLKTPRGILSFPLSNPYTDEDLQKKWKRQKEIKGNYLQHINFTCSYQHESSILAAWGNSSNLPANLRKIADVDIAKYTQDNWEELRHEWEPYAKRDTLCLGACLIKYNQVTKEVVNQNMSNNLTAPSLSLKGWYYLYHYDKEMVEEECEYPRAESGRPFLPEEEKEFVKLFNKQKFRLRTAILTVWFEYPKNMFFQPIPAKDKITFTNKEGKKETGNKIRFRNGFCHDVLTSVDIQEIVKAGGRIIRILDGIVYEENFKTPPYRDYILILRDLRNKYKREGNIVGSNCMKLLGNSLYGKSIQKDIFTTRHLWNEATLQANFDSRVKTYEKINDTQYIVETEIEEKEITTEDSKSTGLTPSHLGSFVLSHSKKILNNFIHVINGFYKPEIYYTDTDSLYISSKNWKKLNRAGLAPKVKYNIVLTSDGVLKEKKTFKGYSNDKISVEDYVQLASGHDVSNEFNKPWEKSFTNGVVIPNDKQTKVFRSYLNNVKRKPPNSEGIMYPYNDKDEYSFDENYEFDDSDYLSNQEENEDCFK
ncbi:hypothetical protein LOTGIDRAFT_172416 [Lottia gigantea]|uniref:DNA-directed DNA polymerase n=1 Tax=Lottia gigantea TaxID=225164 RepID=V4ACM6_LOTGI|nr:hypothetical protein LOTGIDRAFT_172416 [Lottia gigantea]ESP01769.1 hypothetical protein LOTGIDRAFT_172416 [Lottia gigantea]